MISWIQTILKLLPYIFTEHTPSDRKTTIMNDFLLVSGMTTLVNHLYNLSIRINFLISNSINFAKYEENSVNASQILAT